MRWLRENWLDFLIFLLIALVAAGIVLYLTGVNPFARPQGAAPGAVPPAPRPEASSQGTPLPAPETPSPPEETVITVIPLPEAPKEEPPPRAEAASPSRASPPSPSSPSPAPTGRYRVAVGSFANPENALKLQRELQAKGYPARLEAAGPLTRVVVGPYATEAEASRVAQALASYGAQVYRGQGALPPEERVYLQVGAFQKEENALTLSGKLREMGLPVVLVRDGLYRVRVGPVAEGEVEAYKTRLKALGLEAVEVR